MSDVMKERYAKIAATFDGLNVVQLGKAMVAAEKVLERIRGEKAEAEAVYEYLRTKLPGRMEEEGVTKLTVSEDDKERRIRVQEEIFVSATQESGAAERVIEVLKTSGNGGLVKETVAPATLKAFVGRIRKVEAGEPINPTFKELLDAGMTVRAVDMARFY